LLEGEVPSPVRAVGSEPAILKHREIAPGHFVAEDA
jgi:glutathione transport system ATP-binding protein